MTMKMEISRSRLTSEIVFGEFEQDWCSNSTYCADLMVTAWSEPGGRMSDNNVKLRVRTRANQKQDNHDGAM